MEERDSGSGPDDPTLDVAFEVIDDPAVAELVVDPERARWLVPFLGRERSASQAARELGERLDTTLYRIRTLRAAGLLRIVREQPRAGRPIKIYRSSADGYFVPYASTPYADLTARLLAERSGFAARAAAGLARALQRAPALGRRIYRAANGRVWRDSGSRRGPVEAPGRDGRGPVLGDVVSDELRLEDDDARALLAEFEALMARYGAKRSARGERYLVGFTFVRDPASAGAADEAS